MIYIGSDHGGFDLKQEILDYIKNDLKQAVEDVGCFDKKSIDYPDVAVLVADKVLNHKGLGILICGTGIGISISANKIKGIRCALCSEEYSARMTRLHNNSNVLALGGRTVGPEVAKSVVKAFLETPFSEDERHQRRIDKVMGLE
ncbi:MAG: ribose 5-phosphate isomerase B [Spirochaetes bacterium]|nr:ribose 5-phosphate isomerase B [Spirochaetota bacterium]